MVVVDGETTTAAGPIENGQALFFAVSATVDGDPVMRHPLTEGSGTLGSAPVIRVEDQNTRVISNGSLLDPRSDKLQITIRAFDVDQQVPELTVVSFARDAERGMETSVAGRLSCFEPVAMDQSNVVQICDLPTGNYQERVSIKAQDGDGQASYQSIYVGPEYVAMGDSFSSGEGAVPEEESVETLGPDRYWFSQFGETDKERNQCHRSTEAYPNLLRGQGGVPDRIEFVACSGAETWNIDPDGRSRVPDETGNLLEAAGQHGEPIQAKPTYPYASHVTLSIGGNDAGFGDIIKWCSASNLINPGPGGVCQALRQGDADHAKEWLRDTLPQTYRAVLRSVPNADIYVMGYPRFFKDSWYNVAKCPFSVSSDNLFTAGISAADQTWINAQISEMNRVIRESIIAVDSSRLHFVDLERAPSTPNGEVDHVFEGHQACESEPWMNDLEDAGTALLDKIDDKFADLFSLKTNTVYSFHPNRQGHLALKERFLEWIVATEGNKKIIGQGETKASTWVVQPGQRTLLVATSWDGSDIVTTLTSPSGRVIQRDTQSSDVEHTLTPTSETYLIVDPEPGEWFIESYGADVPYGSELLRCLSRRTRGQHHRQWPMQPSAPTPLLSGKRSSSRRAAAPMRTTTSWPTSGSSATAKPRKASP